jgi:hypothetical protein
VLSTDPCGMSSSLCFMERFIDQYRPFDLAYRCRASHSETNRLAFDYAPADKSRIAPFAAINPAAAV